MACIGTIQLRLVPKSIDGSSLLSTVVAAVGASKQDFERQLGTASMRPQERAALQAAADELGASPGALN